MAGKDETKTELNFDSHVMSESSIAEYLAWEKEKGLTEKMQRQLKGPVLALYRWLPEDKRLDREQLRLWRQDLEARCLSKDTISSYIKSVNRYLDYFGCSYMRFTRGRSHDLRNMRFGYLIALEPTDERHRKDVLWLCRCKCGNECKVPATSLLAGNTLSCGCLKTEHIKAVNKYIDHTSLRMSLEDKVKSERSLSGYTGVVPKRGQWAAQIMYKGKNYYLGTYAELEKAVRARSVAKQLVQEDAAKLLEIYEELHKDEEKPDRVKTQIVYSSPNGKKAESKARRNDNKSGCTGVYKRRDKWLAKITYQKKTYLLGSFDKLEDAVSARKRAERMLQEEPQRFLEETAKSFAVYSNK
ncbi:MAG: hypothetical protein IJE09_04165 [Oscillospiraceae bacterium]|nr:hypothetical protein [Oscillospiraceae bacterium]